MDLKPKIDCWEIKLLGMIAGKRNSLRMNKKNGNEIAGNDLDSEKLRTKLGFGFVMILLKKINSNFDGFENEKVVDGFENKLMG